MDRYRVPPGQEIRLEDRDPGDESAFTAGKKLGKKAATAISLELEHMQELLYASGHHRLLVVLQAMDTGGKDGTIRRVFEGVNPVGVKVASFKKPTETELAHDYLWRVHPHVPGNGEITIFNRSHYEEVLVVRVNDLVPPERWDRRYDHIVAFERMLAEEGTTIVKFFLHISYQEQRSRLQERIDDPQKHWKFATGDLEERKKWADYQHAYEDALSRTSTDFAPWYVVPANRKWYRDLVVGTVLVETLQGLELSYPEPETAVTGLVVD